MEKIIIRDKEYTFIQNYKEDNRYREAFNELTNRIWGFSFENWYQSGYWDDKCQLYSLFDEKKMVSHITVSIFDCMVLGNKQRFMQLGTVMTDDPYRNMGLNKVLMEKVLTDWQSRCDMIYLFANDSVLDYYPKFGFSAVNEYELRREAGTKSSSFEVRKIDMDTIEDTMLLDRVARSAKPLFDLSIVDNIGTLMFYCKSTDIFKNKLYYIPNLDTIAVAEYKDNELIVHDVLSAKGVDIEVVVSLLLKENTEQVILRFTPINKKGYETRMYKEEDLTLFVTSDKKSLFENNKLIFPTLSHT